MFAWGYKGSENTGVFDYFVFSNSEQANLDKYDSDEIQNRLTVGQWYEITPYGQRDAKLHKYPNIIKVSAPMSGPLHAYGQTKRPPALNSDMNP